MEGSRVIPIMKGLSVSRRVSRMASLKSASVSKLAAVRFPIPPAFETAAQSLGLPNHIMDPQIMGY